MSEVSKSVPRKRGPFVPCWGCGEPREVLGTQRGPLGEHVEIAGCPCEERHFVRIPSAYMRYCFKCGRDLEENAGFSAAAVECGLCRGLSIVRQERLPARVYEGEVSSAPSRPQESGA